jgi:hypothetical protein
MKEAPLKLQKQAIRNACRYRDSLDSAPRVVKTRLFAERQEVFQRLIKAMECDVSRDEDMMVAENLARIVAKTPVRKLIPGEDY